MKNRHKLRGFAALLLLVAIAAGIVAMFPILWDNAEASSTGYFEQDSFVEQLYEGGYVLYYRMQKAGIDQNNWQPEETASSPVNIFFPQAESSLREKWFSGDSAAMSDLDVLTEACQRVIDHWENNFERNWSGLEYLILDYYGEVQGGNANSALVKALQYSLFGSGEGADGNAFSKYSFYVVMTFDHSGRLQINQSKNATSRLLEKLSEQAMQDYWLKTIENNVVQEPTYPVLYNGAHPNGMTVAFAIPQPAPGYTSHIEEAQRQYELHSVLNTGFIQLFNASLFLAMAIGLIMTLFDKEARGRFARIPLEIAAVMAAVPFALPEPLANILLNGLRGEPIARFGIHIRGDLLTFPQPGKPSMIAGYAAGFLVMLLFLACEYAALYAVGRVRHLGVRAYLARHSLIVRAILACLRAAKRLLRWAAAINLTDSGDRAVVKVVLVNFVVLTVFCCLWFAGIIGVIIYSVLLFLVLRKYMRQIKRQFSALLNVAGDMAQGRLDAAMDSDLGLFEPLGEELQKVQDGFRKAVDSEVKSRSMKTELVANVSHDLKTPLTAIITYVGLLKNEEITEEERRSYIDTLDQKSQRLKRLIEDLFEMSRVSTGNVSFTPVPVDLPSLIRQVQLELKDEIEASGIEFRNRFSEEKAGALLDGEKTSRIFENFILNITKYGMPGTRAYVDLILRGGKVTVKLSNVSREPLDFETTDITDRFVRGDRARNTEGSGLGLAIAKSLVELQGGKLAITTDGDLFKVTVVFPASIARPGSAFTEGEEPPPEVPAAEIDPAPPAPIDAGNSEPLSNSEDPVEAAPDTGEEESDSGPDEMDTDMEKET